MDKEEIEERLRELDVHFSGLLEKKIKEVKDDIIQAVAEVVYNELLKQDKRIKRKKCE